MGVTRRQFLAAAVGVAAADLFPRGALGVVSKTLSGAARQTAPLPPLLGNRFLTFNTVVRVNQIEAARDRDVGHDESALHTPERARIFRKAIERGWPGARITWAFSWKALQDPRPNYKAIRELAVEYRQQHGDELTFIPGAYFSNMYNTREQVNRDLHEALQRVSELVGGGYRPRAVVAGFLSAANQRYLAEHEGIHVCQGNVWSQYGIDNGDGDGSISYPYYPSTEHFCKPAQGPGDFIDCVNLDGWTCDFISARRVGAGRRHNSRLGVGPIEALMQGRMSKEDGLREMTETVATHFDRGFELNRFAWVTNCMEVSLAEPDVMEYVARWLRGIRERWPGALCPTMGEYGLAWREHFKDNAKIDYRFEQRGTGLYVSDMHLEIRWFMNRDFRLALLRDWIENRPAQVIDFTRYDLKAEEPKDLQRNWSLLGKINQKGRRPQDKPVALSELTVAEQALIRTHYPDLFS